MSVIEGTTLNQAWGALRAVLGGAFSFHDIKEIVGLAGIDVTHLAPLVQRAGGGASKGQLITALDGEIRQLDQAAKSRILPSIAEQIVARRPGESERLDECLERLGWQFTDSRLIPIELFDISELSELPDAARDDLLKATVRLRGGDLDGALAAACGAVDSATRAVEAEQGMKRRSRDGFQARCTAALRAKGTISGLAKDLRALGWQEHDADQLVKSLFRSLNQAAYVMQALRSKMSDVHGSKRVLSPLVFDSLKWAALIVRMLK